jgi:prepilin-type N-terminal cleavage/methylation domain-containing protein
MKYKHSLRFIQKAFSLIEMAVVLFIVALLLGGLLPTVSSQIEQQKRTETRKQLDDIQQALIGYAIINSRLPCPSSGTNDGAESFDVGGDASNGQCSNFYNGFVPAAALGITSGVDTQGRKGYAVDSWGNRIRYAVTSSNTRAFVTTGGMSSSFATLASNLLVCSTSTGITISSCSAGNELTSNPGVPVIIFSTGANGANGGISPDEAANLNGTNVNLDRTFVSHTTSPSPNEFDDMVIWISPNTLVNRMVSAGKLP